MNLNRKGFTLVEMLAVVIILGILATIMVPTITAVIEKNKEDNLDNLKKSIISAAKVYISDHRYDITLSGNACSASNNTRYITHIGDTELTNSSQIPIQELVNDGDLTTNKDNKILNPIDNNKSLDLGGSYVEVKYDCAKKDYVYGDSNGEPHLEWNP